MTNGADPRSSRSVVTASQWQRAQGQEAIEWMRSSGIAQRMLEDVCQAVEITVEALVADNADCAREVLEKYPRVLSSCDQLDFDEIAQALAYLIVTG